MRSRIPTSAFLTVADFPLRRSILILSRTVSFFSWIEATVLPFVSSSLNVSRIRAAFPLTLKTLVPDSSSIQ